MATPRIIALATLKPGSGKSTLAACLAAHWRAREEAVALIDADRGTKSKWTEEDRSAGALRGDPRPGPAARRSGARVGAAPPARAHRHLARSRCHHDRGARRRRPGGRPDAAVAGRHQGRARDRGGSSMRSTAARRDRAGRSRIRFLLTSAGSGQRAGAVDPGRARRAGLGLLSATMTRRPEYSNAAFSGATPVTTHPDGIAAREIAAIAREIENTPVAGAG